MFDGWRVNKENEECGQNCTETSDYSDDDETNFCTERNERFVWLPPSCPRRDHGVVHVDVGGDDCGERMREKGDEKD